MTHAVACAEFERWLDDGAGDAHAHAMRAHAAACARCGEMLATMEAIDRWLAEPPSAPAHFSDGVMNRVARLEQVRPAIAWTAEPVDVMPWWAAILRQPAVVLATVVAALLMWRGDVLVRLALAGASWLATAVPAASARALHGVAAPLRDGAAAAPGGGLGTDQLLAIGLGLGLAPVVAYASFAVGGWVTRWVTRTSRSA